MNNKKLRIYLGFIMFYGFFSLAFSLNFLIGVCLATNQYLLVFFILWYMWMPSVMIIGLTYFLLTKIFKYKEVEKEDE